MYAAVHPGCLCYAHEHGAPWDGLGLVGMDAAANGRLDCLRYAHEHGAPWNNETCKLAATNGHLDCLRYAFLCGAPWPTAPPEMVAWRDRVRGTARDILRIVRDRAAKTIQYAAIPFIHRPGGQFVACEIAKWSDVHLSELT